MTQLPLEVYRIDMKYIRNLHNIDDRIFSVSPQTGKDERPFLGIIIVCNKHKYCVPLSKPKKKHERMRAKRIVYSAEGSIICQLEYEYDEMGNKTKEIRHPGNGSSVSYSHEYKYDEEGRLIRYTYYDDDGIIKEFYESAYDEMGNLIKKSSLKKGTKYGYHFNILGELFVFKTMKEESVTEYEYEYAYID